MSHLLSRRDLVRTVPCIAGAVAAAQPRVAQAEPNEPPSRFRYCLNTSTIRGQKLPLDKVVDLAGKAGYDGIEPWIGEIISYVEAGGSLSDLRKRIADQGLTVDSAIGFAKWIVDDEAERKEGFEQAARDMELVRQLGGTRIAAPPVGAHRSPGPDLSTAARRYRALLELGDKQGVVPQVEVWGFSQTLSRLGEAVFVAVESGHPRACLLPDIYHIYKGGSGFAGLNLLGPAAIHVFHVNDYPTTVPHAEVSDADRVYPGDGDAPVTDILRGLAAAGIGCALSLELFNRQLWQQPAERVAADGLAKMKEAVARAVG